MTFRIAILVFDGYEELDAIGPWEIFRVAQDLKPDELNCVILSPDGRDVHAAKGLKTGVEGAFEPKGSYDLIVVPGGVGTRALSKEEMFLDRLRHAAGQARWIGSVCTGALVLAAAGVLAGRDCTTHHYFYEELEKTGPVGRILKGRRYVEDGPVITAAGISAGIDMSLWILGQLFSPDFAREVQAYAEYYPDPPYSKAAVRG